MRSLSRNLGEQLIAWKCKLSDSSSISAEAFQRGRVVKHIGRKEFQTHSAMEPRVFGFINDTHTATTEFLDDAKGSPGEVLDRVARDGEVFVVERNGQPKACLVPVSFLLPAIS